ncbi:methyltransferase domain-containing protein [Sphingobium sp. WCS2017Hpa-17]|uniref:methyltransferase domain-containing protein n=1 Tax=Sphingobium sp. WCS2017Hpa-17 TaxID=3073638 RepID=UPI00288C3804|nr:methyltransferase domain-containing protein [Sphingobium sp. WCS2017Hpa-17]
MENMARCVTSYMGLQDINVIDLGAMNVNGSYRTLMPDHANYVGVDLEAGPGVDIVLQDVYRLPFEDSSIDIVMSGQMLEHCAHFWKVFTEISRVLKPGGKAFIIAPSSGPVHRYPVDCYRFYPDSYQALAEWSGLRMVQSWTDERGPWCDLVGIFQKGGDCQPQTQAAPIEVVQNYQQAPYGDPAAEQTRGVRPYLEVLRDLHALKQPQSYLEIGVRKGASLALAKCKAIAIDPDPHPSFRVDEGHVDFHRCTSDDFFFFHRNLVEPRSVDFAFIDGMHLAEYVLRDFMNVERLMSPNGIIVIDDVLPNHPVQARRERQSQVWSGDVWRFVELLKKERQDLNLHLLDTQPTGLLVVTKPAANNRILWNKYNKISQVLANGASAQVPRKIIDRKEALVPTMEMLAKVLGK